MKRRSFILTIFLVLFWNLTAYALDVPCFRNLYTRDKGKPVTVPDTFISALEGAGKITIKNGVEGAKPVTSATVRLNGGSVCGPSDFNSNVTELVIVGIQSLPT